MWGFGRDLTPYSSEDAENVHRNAKSTYAGRAVLVRRIEGGERPEVVSVTIGVSRRTAFKWFKRFRAEGRMDSGTGVRGLTVTRAGSGGRGAVR